MRNVLAAVLTATFALSLSTSASAQEDFGLQGTFALGAERVFGITSYKTTVDVDVPGAPEVESSGTTVSMLWGFPAVATGFGVSIPVPASIPRIGFDYFVIDSLSIGGSLGFYTSSGDFDPGGGQPSEDQDDVSVWAFAPRVGYAIPLGNVAVFWPRGGFTYMAFGVKEDNDDEVDGNLFMLELEPAFVFTPAGNFGILLSPVLDIPIAGGGEFRDPGEPTVDYDASVFSFGVYGGLIGWF